MFSPPFCRAGEAYRNAAVRWINKLVSHALPAASEQESAALQEGNQESWCSSRTSSCWKLVRSIRGTSAIHGVAASLAVGVCGVVFFCRRKLRCGARPVNWSLWILDLQLWCPRDFEAYLIRFYPHDELIGGRNYFAMAIKHGRYRLSVCWIIIFRPREGQ